MKNYLMRVTQEARLTIADLPKPKAANLPLLWVSDLSWTYSLYQSLSFRHRFTMN